MISYSRAEGVQWETVTFLLFGTELLLLNTLARNTCTFCCFEVKVMLHVFFFEQNLGI